MVENRKKSQGYQCYPQSKSNAVHSDLLCTWTQQFSSLSKPKVSRASPDPADFISFHPTGFVFIDASHLSPSSNFSIPLQSLRSALVAILNLYSCIGQDLRLALRSSGLTPNTLQILEASSSSCVLVRQWSDTLPSLHCCVHAWGKTAQPWQGTPTARALIALWAQIRPCLLLLACTTGLTCT